MSMKGEMCMIGGFSLQNMKKGGFVAKMEVVYNVKYKFKNNENKTNEELKELFNRKLLNIIIKLENQKLGLNNS